MASEKQIAANRLNSQKSTGPRSDAGKQASRMNALKSGLHAESHTIRGEDPEALVRLTAEYHAEFRPVTPRQRELVDTVVHNTWLIRRLRLTETELHALHFQGRDDNFEEKWRFKVLQRQYPLADSFASLETRLLRLQSRLNSLERSTRVALKELQALQAEACQPAEESSTSSPIGFVPSDPQALPPESRTADSPEPDAPAARIPNPQSPAPEIGFVPSNAPVPPAMLS